MNNNTLDDIGRRWSPDAHDVHQLIAMLKRPACERAIQAVMDCDKNERDLIVRLCNSLDESSQS